MHPLRTSILPFLLAAALAHAARAQGSDDCATPQPIAGAGTFAFDTTLATADGFLGQQNDCGAVDADVWFVWTAPASGAATVSTCGGAAFDTQLAVYTAGSCPIGAASVCDADACGVASSLSFTAAVGSPYLIQVGSAAGVAGGTGTFAISLGGPELSPYCFGDGSGSQCPCGNSGASGRGCASSAAAAGALLAASGTASVSADTLLLACADLPASSFALFLQGSLQANGGLGVPFGDGLSCLGGPLVQLGVRRSAGGAASLGSPAGSPAISQLGAVPALGGTYSYQARYRDPTSFCTAASFNATNGVEVVWVP